MTIDDPSPPEGDDAPTGDVDTQHGATEEDLPSLRRVREQLPGLKPGDTLGRFTIRSILGEGGFGVVYRATQTEPVRRDVALKVIKPGMDSKAVLARFEAERQALALMEHPFVATVLDGGVTDDARPYFVMEFVRGEPITEFCDKLKMGVRDRVALLAKVCEAVQHAHSKGLIHRDIKPSNILVTIQGDEAVPKVIDFGIAKALNQKLAEGTIFTHVGQMLGTPEYMSPEQAEASSIDIDTRTDIYSLGAVLYELLTGSRAFDSMELRSAGFEEMRRVIREVDPPRPSTRLSAHAEDAASIAATRRTEVKGLSGTLRRDLDWVIMKCLEKDRMRRYTTASELALELRRYLADEPVLAGPPSLTYRVSKFIKRHRAGVLVTSGLAAAIVIGVVGTVAGLLEANQQASIARREAELKLDVADFLTRNLITEISPYETGPDTTVSTLLDAASSRVDRDVGDDPRTEALVRNALGVAYRDLGLREIGLEQITRAVELLDGVAAETTAKRADVDAAWARLDLATALWRVGRADEALKASSAAFDVLGAEYPDDDQRVLRSRTQLASAMKHSGDAERAERIYRECLDLAGAEGDPDWRSTTRYNLALAIQSQGRLDEALTQFEAVLDAQADASGPDGPKAVRTRSELASCLTRLARYDEAENVYNAVIPQLEAVFGDDHPRTTQTLANRGVNALRGGDSLAAEQHLLLAIERIVRQETWSQRFIPVVAKQLANALVENGRVDNAVITLETAIREIRAVEGLEDKLKDARVAMLACHAVELFTPLDPALTSRFRADCPASSP
ncbi:MAG: serine/threonine-protein kinase [Planctomycetota bacterium]